MTPAAALILDLPAIHRGGRPVLGPVRFDLPRGAWCGLIGINGVGKTSLLLTLSGRLGPLTKGVTLDGVALDTAHDRVRQIGSAVAPERLPPEIKSGALIRMVGKAQGVDPYSEHLTSLYKALALSDLNDQIIGSMSAGQKQRLGLYLGFIGHPPVVLLDEPFNALDPLISFNLKQALRALCDNGLILITALHDMSLMALNCTHGLMLSQGQLTQIFTPDDMIRARINPTEFERHVLSQWQDGNSTG